MTLAGDWEASNLEPCMCIAREDWEWSDVIRPVLNWLRRLHFRGNRYEVPF
jgi:hypothetical protein